MAQEVVVVLAVVIPDEPPESRGKIRDLRGRELPGVPGSWVTRVAIHTPTAVTESDIEDGTEDGTGSGVETASAADQHRSGGARIVPGQLTADEREHELDLDYGTATADS